MEHVALQNNKEDIVAGLKKENDRLKESIQELSTLNELSAVITSTMSLDNILNKVVSSSVKAINAEQGTIHLLDKSDEAADPFKTLIRKADETTPQDRFRLDVELSGWMLAKRQPLLVNDFDSDKRFLNREAGDLKIKTLLSVPLVCKGKLVGVLNLFNKKNTSGFSQNDQRLLTIIASQSAQVIEHARLYEQEKHLLQIEKELEMAHEIQSRLLPKESPAVPGFDIAGASYAAKNVGGDYYDFIELEGGRWFIVLGDVSGKGIPAALLMSHLQATIRNQAMSDQTLVECISKSNNFLYLNTEGNKFVTLFGGILNPARQEFNYINAGHNFPYHLKKDGTLEPLKVGGLIMGIMPDVPYEDGTVKISRDELVVIYSDGVTEADNEFDDMFGEERLQELIAKHHKKSASELVAVIYDAVQQHEGSTDRDDDITIVVIKAV